MALPHQVPACRIRCRGILVALVLAISACTPSAPPPQESVNRGRVIDQDTGQPIPGVIVVARYVGSVRGSGATSCNRVETAVSDENGWFEVPLDPDAGPLWLDGYHKDYRRGYPVRVPTCGINGDPEQCQIWQDRRDDDDHVVSVVKEPTIYRGEAAAMKAARYWNDLYLKRFKGTREERLQELWRLPAANSCLAPPKTSQGLLPFLQAILQEQIALDDYPQKTDVTRERITFAREALSGRK